MARGATCVWLGAVALLVGVACSNDAGASAGSDGGSRKAAASNAYRAIVLADRPAGYWRLGDAGTALKDEIGAHDGAYAGGVAHAQPGALKGDSNGAVSFDGTSGYARVADSDSLDITSGVTLEAWVKRSKSGSFQTIFGKPGTGQSKNENYSLWVNLGNQVIAYFGDGSRYISVSADLDGEWRHVVATYDNATAKLYLDGALVASTPSTIQLTANGDPLNIGRSTGSSSFFGGLIDEIAVYPSVLSAARIRTHYLVGRAIDASPPVVSVVARATGRVARLSGAAAKGKLDARKVTVRVWRGPDVFGAPFRTVKTTRKGASFSTLVRQLRKGIYTARAEQRDAAGNTGYSRPWTFGVGRKAPPAGRLLLAAGDIASCTETGRFATTAILDRFPTAAVSTIGDNAYQEGTTENFMQCYDPTWGRALKRTRPVLGDHEYGSVDVKTPGASGYFTYFHGQLAKLGPTALDPSKGYYSYDLGAWHIVALNAPCYYLTPGCSPAAQERWLRADLASHRSACTLAFMHYPLFTSLSGHSADPHMRLYWTALYDAGAELVLSGNNHNYERFARLDPFGDLDPETGIRQFVVGTGGAGRYAFRNVAPHSEVRDADTYGVMKLTLLPGRYEWEFVPEAGRTFTDTGSERCHGAPAG